MIYVQKLNVTESAIYLIVITQIGCFIQFKWIFCKLDDQFKAYFRYLKASDNYRYACYSLTPITFLLFQLHLSSLWQKTQELCFLNFQENRIDGRWSRTKKLSLFAWTSSALYTSILIILYVMQNWWFCDLFVHKK